ncbi:MAG: molybdenum ABC transporter ATP-binding protein [Candidatus Glassbacteria bacterium]|nr:molybdenum ABC transporter ATP-binding protein [Candidatus Glassbacteria bacterium]
MIELAIRVNRGGYSLEADLTSRDQATGLYGRSGSGKTTILSALAGIIRPGDGHIAVLGGIVFDRNSGVDLAPEQRRLGVVFQDNLLFPHLSTLDNLLFGYRRVPANQRSLSPGEIFDLLDLAPLLNHRVDQLSGGEARRVAIGRALLCSPRMLLLDEPLSGLDTALQHRVLAYLLRLKSELGIPMIYVSHSFPDLCVLTDRVALLKVETTRRGLRLGRVAAVGTPYEIMPEVEKTDSLGPLETVIPGSVRETRPELGYSVVQAQELSLKVPHDNLHVGDRVYVTVQADEIILSTGELPRLSARNVWPGTVVELQRMTGTTLATVDVGVPLLVELTAEAVEHLGLEPGAAVRALVKTKSLRTAVIGQSADK